MKNLISYEEGSIANLDLAHTDNMKFVLMAFDEGQDYELTAGQSFRFDKNGLHSVTAQGKFKMSLLLVLE